jgi:quaternary ammonium compound-resistance protein SugE
MGWIALLAGGLMEISFALGMKYNHGFTRFWPSVATILQVMVSLYLLSLAVRTIPLGTAYVVWTGIGSVGTVTIGVILFGESTDVVRLLCVTLIVLGSLGLKFLSPG